eukprot:g13341.t1
MATVQKKIIDPLVQRKILLEATSAWTHASRGEGCFTRVLRKGERGVHGKPAEDWRRQLGHEMGLVVAPGLVRHQLRDGDEQRAKVALARAMVLPPAAHKADETNAGASWVGSCVERDKSQVPRSQITTVPAMPPKLVAVDDATGKRRSLASWTCGCCYPFGLLACLHFEGVLLGAVLAAGLLRSITMAFSLASISAAETQASNLLSSLQSGTPQALHQVTFVQLIVRMIPGLAVLMLGYAGYRIYSTGSFNKSTVLGLVVALGLTYGLIRLGQRFGPGAVRAPLARDAAGQPVRSGELVLMQSGEVVLRPDPRQAAGSAEPGWQEALAQSIQVALVQGQEQVVLDFSRKGCAYCAKQLPVLEAEFPQLAQGFQVQAFPTLWIFGHPQVDPIVTQGFMERPKLEERATRKTIEPNGSAYLQWKSSWRLAYSLRLHGVSLKTFYRRMQREGPSLLVIQDHQGHVFGGFAASAWRLGDRYYGTGESFVFRFRQPKPKPVVSARVEPLGLKRGRQGEGGREEI